MTTRTTDVQVRPGDGFLAEAAARPDLPTPQTKTGETTMLSPHTRHDPRHDPGAETTDWRARARCRDVDPEIFFPTAESGHLLEAGVAEARTVCAGCPVTAQCLEFARDRLPYGIAGGLTPAERRRDGSTGRPSRRARSAADGRHSETADAGRAALRAGTSPAEVAREFGVSDRTVCRWGAANRAESPTAATTGVGRGVA